MSKRSLPWLQFYPSDWLSDSVAGCCLAAQGLWLRMLFVAHNSQRYGYLEADGKPIPDELMFRRCGCASVEEYRNLLAELFAAGVPSRTPEGTTYSRRMVRDQEERSGAAERQRRHRSHASVTPLSQGEVRSQSQKSESEKSKKPAASPPADPRRVPFIDFAHKSYEQKHSRKPLWQSKDWKGLAGVLKSHSADALPLDRLRVLWENYAASTDIFTVKQGDSLAYFSSNLDKFSDGPITENSSLGVKHGKPTTSDNMRTTLESFRASEQKYPA